MRTSLTRTALTRRIASAFSDPRALAAVLPSPPALTPQLQTWIARLMLLYGVPFDYLVPDEGMLPPESIRFFHVDMNWIAALADGAMSIARNPSASGTPTPSMVLDALVVPRALEQAQRATGEIRAARVGAGVPSVTLQTVTGFLLRSSVVRKYPQIGVNVYPYGATPDDSTVTLLTVLRWETLGPSSDTLICLVDGEAYRADVHEPAEHLHYGIDEYSDVNGTISASKSVHTFTRDSSTGAVTMDPNGTNLDLSTSFRSLSPRTLRVADAATLIGNLSGAGALDSAELGFEMTEGVGVVKFVKETQS
ncbi:MAG TPA: hypothetical protein VHS78_19380 [Candidatus Elarobacter sp.]|jgi:hypothetical protein|nr:hypothetical protein [Candidatus Elarobacter sp.]